MERTPPPILGNVLERFLPAGSVRENFHPPGEEGFYPNRIVKERLSDGTLTDTQRMHDLWDIINNALADHYSTSIKTKYRQKLYDLIISNCYGKIFPAPDNASDFAGVVDTTQDSKDQRFENCITLIKGKDGKLKFAGAFNYCGEAPTQTAARVAAKELGVSKATNYVFLGEQSKPNRDPRSDPKTDPKQKGKVIITSFYGGLVNPHELSDEVIIVPLFTQEGGIPRFNNLSIKGGVLTDSRGKQVEYTGFFADHKIMMKQMFENWQTHNQIDVIGRTHPLSLAETLKEQSRHTPQEWFENYKDYPESKGKINISGTEISLTPNIEFALSKTEDILTEYDTADKPFQKGWAAHQRALEFVKRCVEKDILPEHQGPATAVDCVMPKVDNIRVLRKKNRRLTLVGTFYSAEAHKARESGRNLRFLAESVMSDKIGIDARVCCDLGTVGGTVAMMGKQADERFPRVSFPKVLIDTGTYDSYPKDLPEGTEIIDIPIWKDKANGIISDEILHGIDGMGWDYGHNEEIIIPLFIGKLRQLNPAMDKTAEEVFFELLRPSLN